MKEKTFFNWRSNLRHVTMLLMALFLCVGNAWGEVSSPDSTVWKSKAVSTLETGVEYRVYVNGYSTTNKVTVTASGSYPNLTYTRTNDIKNHYAHHFLSDNEGSSATTKAVEDPISAGVFKLESTGTSGVYKIILYKNSNSYYFHKNSASWSATGTSIGTFSFEHPSGAEDNRFSIKATNNSNKYICIGSKAPDANKVNIYQYGIASTALNTLNNASSATYTQSYYSLENIYNCWYIIPEADYQSVGHSFYYSANAKIVKYAYGATPSISSAVVDATAARASWSDEVFADMAGASVSGNTRKWATSITKDAYFKYSTPDGYVFRGWHDGNGNLIEGSGDNYNPTLTVANTTSSSSPEDKTVYAYFEAMPLFQATLLDASGNTVMDGDDPKQYSLADALTAAQANYTVVLQEDVALTSTLNLNKAIKLDFNNHTLSSALDAAVNVTSTVTFTDHSTTGLGGINSTGATAVSVGDGGNLTIDDGVYVATTNAVVQSGTGVVTIKGGGFQGSSQDVSGTITVQGGYFVHNTGLNAVDPYVLSSLVPDGMKFSNETYRYMVVDKNSPNYPAVMVIWYEGSTKKHRNFNSLTSAIDYANNNASTGEVILMLEDATLGSGTYTISAKDTLVIPYQDYDPSRPAVHVSAPRAVGNVIPSSVYCQLTMEDGAHLNVYGALEVGGVQSQGSTDALGDEGVGRPGGTAYGMLYMNEGSSITMDNGSNLFAWGFVVGDGTIDVHRNASVSEQFQVMDWRGVQATLGMISGGMNDDTLKVLPISQYYIQNVEVRTKYRPGAKLYGQFGISVVWPGIPQPVPLAYDSAGIVGVRYSQTAHQSDANLKDDAAIFLMDDEDDSDDTWVLKYYDAENDLQVYEVNNSAYLGSLKLVIDLSMIPMVGKKEVNSAEYSLPITNNFLIHLLSGKLAVTQDTELLPGAEIKIDKESTLTINSGQLLKLYDSEQWGKYIFRNFEDEFGYASQVRFRPFGGNNGEGGAPNKRDLTLAGVTDAKLTIHGSVDVKGYLKTTIGDLINERYIDGNSTKARLYPNPNPTIGGGSITSTVADAGTIIFSKASPSETGLDAGKDFTWQNYNFVSSSRRPEYRGAHIVSALLQNGAGSKFGAVTRTANTAAGQSYCFIDFDGDGVGEWMSLTNVNVGGCNMFVKDQNNVHYIKPQAYVPISIGLPQEEADHTYRDHYAGTNRIFIEVECVWWEVEETETPGIFFSDLNKTYYYYDDDVWVEKKYNVYWRNYNGDTLKFVDKYGKLQNHYELPHNSHPQWLSATPTRPNDNYYTYDFKGWLPEINENTKVTSDIVYTAQYDTISRQYLITFENAEHSVLEIQYLKMGEMPEYKGAAIGTDKKWTPALSPVTGNATYTLAQKTNSYTITFVNWNGAVIGEPQVLTSGMPTLPADPTQPDGQGNVYPTKPALADETYTFSGWTPEVVEVSADATYMATYTKGKQTYTIRFLKSAEDGGGVISSTSYEYGATPAIPTGDGTTKASTVQYTYTLVWNPLVGTVTGNQDYTATFEEHTRQYTVTWRNWDNSVLAVDYVDYNSPAAYSGLTPKRPTADNLAYTFTGWNTTPATKVTANVEYTAQYSSRTAAMTVNTDQSATPEAADATLQTLTITPSGVLNMGSHKLTVDNLILQATETTSGQLLATNVTATNAYFDLTISATTDLATGATRQWHAFGVPWQVNLDTDPIQEINGEGNVVRTFVLGRDYDIIYYNGDKRATSGPGYWCWEFLENHAHQLQPGQGYMIAFVPSVGNVGTIRLAKKNFAPVMFSGTMSVENAYGQGLNNGWNAIANPKACKVSLGNVPTTGYVYNPATDNYTAFNIQNKDYIVGKTVYVQTNTTKSVVINDATGNPFVAAAPARRDEVSDKEYLSLDDYYQVAIASTTTEGGHVYVLPEEEKENKYVIGHDLAQFGMSAAIPQVWVNRYDTKLALNTTALINEGTAEFPMGVYAPTAGEYTISLNAQPSDEYNVYLTRDGQAIWNLSDGVFTADLKAGIQSNYGLRLTVNKAPQVVTGIDEAIVDANGETRKVMINNQVYIIRGEQVYTIDGQLVK